MSSKSVVISDGVVCTLFHKDLDRLNVQIKCGDLANISLGDVARKRVEFWRADAITTIIVENTNIITRQAEALVGVLDDADDVVDVDHIVLLRHELVSEELKIARITCCGEGHKGLSVQLDSFPVVLCEIVNQILNEWDRHLRNDLVSNRAQPLVAVIIRRAGSRVGDFVLGIIE